MPTVDLGVYKIKCVKPGGYVLTNYGQYSFDQDEEIDLLDETLPSTIRCGSWGTAHNICSDPALELAQLISAGDFVVTESRRPNYSGVLP